LTSPTMMALFGFLRLLCAQVLSAQKHHAPPGDAKQDHAKKIAASAQPLTPAAPDPGERKFQVNCSLCHTAPDQLSPRILDTVVRNMRVPCFSHGGRKKHPSISRP
jgi:cytochrome c5